MVMLLFSWGLMRERFLLVVGCVPSVGGIALNVLDVQ